jgi:phospholipid/cholesterol/gamma-HCH transport system substrate-binding protein
MKFTIRFADQIVGALIILAVGIVIFVIFMLGSSQRWFSRDNYYYTYFPSASGLSQNMAVQYKGFTIGRVKSIQLVKKDGIDQVEVRFSIFDTYIDRVKNGSIVEVVVSPIGALGGSQFIFHPGIGFDLLSNEDTIPAVGSIEANDLLKKGLAQRGDRDDSISNIINNVGATVTTLNKILEDVQEAFAGEDQTKPLGQTLGSVSAAAADLQKMMEEIRPTLAHIEEIFGLMAAPDSSLAAILDPKGKVYTDLTQSLGAVSATLKNLEKTSDFVPAQLPQLALTISQFNSALKEFERVAIAAQNNPLLKKGVPEQKETKIGGSQTREMDW